MAPHLLIKLVIHRNSTTHEIDVVLYYFRDVGGPFSLQDIAEKDPAYAATLKMLEEVLDEI